MSVRFLAYKPLLSLLLLIPFLSVRLFWCLQRDSNGIYIETSSFSHTTKIGQGIVYNKQAPSSPRKFYVHMNKRFEPACPILCNKFSLEPLQLFLAMPAQEYVDQLIPIALRIAQSLRGPPVVA